MATDTQAAAAAVMQKLMASGVIQKALSGDGEGSSESDDPVAHLLRSIPKEDDPKREEWLVELQRRLQEASLREAKEELEKVHSDENGQWMFVLPEPGFCVKCALRGGGKVFINICQHVRIGEPAPIPPSEADDVAEELRFRIPLSCGQARADKDKAGRPCKVYDAIVSPITIKRCATDNEFRRFVAAICMQWIKQKYEPTLNADEFRNLNFKAKGKLEPQRIRLSSAPKASNAMQDEIQLPASKSAPTAPVQVGGASGTGKLVQELDEPAATQHAAGSASGAPARSSVPSAQGSSDAVTTASPGPAVLKVEPQGAYDWSTHTQPTKNVFFRETVPSSYYVELFIPGIQTIREVDVRVTTRKVECFYVDDDNDGVHDGGDGGDASPFTPFLSLSFDYPIAEDPIMAKYIKRTSVLKMQYAVRLPDETTQTRTKPAKDACEEEAEEERLEKVRRDAERAALQTKQERLEEAEAAVLRERKAYVENLAAVQAGEVPPAVLEEVDRMPAEQLPALLHRLEGRLRRNDSIDHLLDTLPSDAIDALSDHLRQKLSLQPLKRQPKGEPVKPSTTTPPKTAEAATSPAPATQKNGALAGATEPKVEYNNAKRSEKLFGVEFHNRYLFALDV